MIAAAFMLALLLFAFLSIRSAMVQSSDVRTVLWDDSDLLNAFRFVRQQAHPTAHADAPAAEPHTLLTADAQPVASSPNGSLRAWLSRVWSEQHPPLPGSRPAASPSSSASPPPRIEPSTSSPARAATPFARAAAPASPFPPDTHASLMDLDPRVHVPAGLAYRGVHGSRGWRVNPIVVPGANTADDPDVVLLQEGESGYEGTSSHPAQRRSAPAGEVDTARRKHEMQAELAIVVVSAPRFAIPPVRGSGPLLRHYFRMSGACGDMQPLRVVDAVGDAAAATASIAQECEADDVCAGFDAASGALYDHIDGYDCGLGHAPAAGDIRAGLYTKNPVTIAPQPYRDRAHTEGDSTWWVAARGDVYQHDVGVLAPSGSTDAAQLADMKDQCSKKADCVGFHWRSGYAKSSTDVTHIMAGRTGEGALYAREEIPPLDYLTATVTSLLRELGGTAGCGALDHGYVEPDRAPPYASSTTKTQAFGGRVHLYVTDTSSLTLQAQDDTTGETRGRGPWDDKYWFASFAYLRRKFGHLPCVSFMPSVGYERLYETGVPAHGRGMPAFHPDNRRKQMGRGQVAQTLDFVSAFRHAAGASPRAHLLVWEDDCVACKGTLNVLADTTAALRAFDPDWGALKVGNGGSGLLFHSDLVFNMLRYVASRRGSENVDVSMWRFLHSGAYSDYLSKPTFSAHRGYFSSFKGGMHWGRVACGNELDMWWGWYIPCDLTRMGDTAASVDEHGATGMTPEQLAQTWRCSIYSPATGNHMPPR